MPHLSVNKIKTKIRGLSSGVVTRFCRTLCLSNGSTSHKQPSSTEHVEKPPVDQKGKVSALDGDYEYSPTEDTAESFGINHLERSPASDAVSAQVVSQTDPQRLPTRHVDDMSFRSSQRHEDSSDSICEGALFSSGNPTATSSTASSIVSSFVGKLSPMIEASMAQNQATGSFPHPWANGGNLLQYWESCPRDAPRENLHWVLGQLVRLCSALHELHSHDVRYGNLKPENILWLGKSNNAGSSGMLQLDDGGVREYPGFFRFGSPPTMSIRRTIRYQPPEMDQYQYRGHSTVRPWACDIWSMGCVILETMIWLLHGYDAVVSFETYTERFWYNDGSVDHVNPFVVEYCKCLEESLPEDTIFRDILNLVQTRLLVIPVAKKDHTSVRYRETAAGLDEAMKTMHERSLLKMQHCNSLYYEPVTLEFPRQRLELHGHHIDVVNPKAQAALVDGQKPKNSFDIAREIRRLNTNDVGLGAEEPKEEWNSWISRPDDEFMKKFLYQLGRSTIRPNSEAVVESAALCRSCRDIHPCRGLSRLCSIWSLQLLKDGCALCQLLLTALTRHGFTSGDSVSLYLSDAAIRLRNGTPLLSIYREPAMEEPGQLGLPHLFDRGSPEQFALLKEWIHVCDTQHDICNNNSIGLPDEQFASGLATGMMPTRLIHVGNPIRLVGPESIPESCRYAALSHCWGELDQPFCTTNENLAKLQESIDFEEMPKTFRDAITVARGLDIEYIWVDSLCIIQGDEADWYKECSRMESIFSSAYVTICASSARSSLDGFLHNPPAEISRRSYVELPAQGSPKAGSSCYVCPYIDHFDRDVKLGPLSSRGWVLQERVLSRRSIHFTSTQIYWECGAGVHCETGSKLQSREAVLFRDAKFPSSAPANSNTDKQILIQNLFEKYSGLELTFPTDRSVAIGGLQARLARTLFGGVPTRAAHGLFEASFARDLLWESADDEPMTPIQWPDGVDQTMVPPTWSWCSKLGTVRYLSEAKFGMVDWSEGKDFVTPFSSPLSSLSGQPGYLTTLKGRARWINLPSDDLHAWLSFDVRQDYNTEDLRCVIIGSDKEDLVDQQQLDQPCPLHHVLVITGVSTKGESSIYERAGVGSLPAENVGEAGDWVEIR